MRIGEQDHTAGVVVPLLEAISDGSKVHGMQDIIPVVWGILRGDGLGKGRAMLAPDHSSHHLLGSCQLLHCGAAPPPHCRNIVC